MVSRFDGTLMVNKKNVGLLSNIVLAKNTIISKRNANSSKGNEKFTIVLDAGHGGADKGTSYENLNEKDINLKIVNYIKKQLEAKGFNIVLTRDRDDLIPLKKIGEITNSSNAKLMISIHINSYKDPGISGITGYYYSPDDSQPKERMLLAEDIVNSICKESNWINNGIKSQNLAVLRYSNIPCALIECGYITNMYDRQKLMDDNTIMNMAQNIALGIVNYIDDNNNR
jgi:N-acetylmuramoyl-L-alanine amidase